MNQEEYKQHFKQAQRNLRYDVPLKADDDRFFVPLDRFRGNYSKQRLFAILGILDDEDTLDTDREHIFLLFGGHRGCGKSTALRRYAKELNAPNRYFSVLIDVVEDLDVHNLRYGDILLAQAKKLIEMLQQCGITMPGSSLKPLEDWFHQRIQTYLEHRNIDAGITTSAEAGGGLPFLGKLFAQLSTSIKYGTTYRNEIRIVVQDSFKDFSQAFNILLIETEKQLQQACLGRRVLFVIDGTDRLRSEDAVRFFVDDVHQLQQITANFIYCAPIVLMSEEGRLQHTFEPFRIPMIKLAEKGKQEYYPEVMTGLRELVKKRVSPLLFANEDTINYLIQMSGEHIRDLIRLLNYALIEANPEPVNQRAAESAVAWLATEYSRYILQDSNDDFALLAKIDHSGKSYKPQSEQSRRLLYNLILLEYNSYWWQTHPVVRTLDAYKQVSVNGDQV